MTLLFADAALAARLERIATGDLIRFGAIAKGLYPDMGADTLRVAGGGALWMGDGSPLNVACGLGFDGEVTVADLETLEAFFAAHASPCAIAVCPLAHESLGATLANRGYSITGFENVLYLALADFERHATDGVEVVEIDRGSTKEWERTVACGFSDSGEPGPAQARLAHIVGGDERARYFTAMIDGAWAGTGELVITDGVGWLSADATLPEYRGRGVQTALQIARLVAAKDAGCELAVTESVPGSASMRNMERRGFRVAYTRVEVVR